MNSLELEVEIGKIARAMMTRNAEIGKDLIDSLRANLTVEQLAGIMILSIERLIYFDADSILWTIKNVIPGDVMHEIRNITNVSVYKQLIGKGFLPGKDFSVDATGKLLVTEKAKKFALHSLTR